MAEWTPRVSERVKLARALKGQMARSVTFGLLEADLDEIIRQGEVAEEADQDQRAQLAQHQVSRNQRSVSATKVKEDEDGLRDRLLSVVGDLKRAGEDAQALWLGKLSFKRYRIRELAGLVEGAAEEAIGDEVEAGDDALGEDSPGEEAEGEATGAGSRRVRVERQDMVNRFRGTAGFCRALLAEDRAVIVGLLAARGFSKEMLEALGRDAKALADQGRNLLQAAEATARESAAAEAQQKRWAECRRMIKKACVGDAELARLLAGC